MVIQRDAPFRVHGTAAAGESVSVTFAGSEKTAKADSVGKWEIEFPSQPGSTEAQEISVKGGAKISPVWVGDVYIAAGGAAWSRRGDTGKADLPAVSIFTVKGAGSLVPSNAADGAWGVSGKSSALAQGIAEHLAAKNGLPVGMVVMNAPTALETWIPRPLLMATPAAEPIIAYFNEKGWSTQVESVEKDYRKRFEAWKKAGNEFPLEPENAPTPEAPKGAEREAPATRFNAMMAPFSGLPASGLVWAHGDSDESVARAAQYGRLLPVAIQGFLENFGKPELPVVIVQIGANRYNRYDDRAGAEIREGQWQAGENEQATTVVTYDLDADHVELARRIARALEEGGDFPSLESHKMVGDGIHLTFRNTGGGLVAKGDGIKGIALKDDGRRWVKAVGVIKGDVLIVSAPGVNKPTAVRYAWQDMPTAGANLAGENGLPVAPFRTDNEPAVTANVVTPGEELRFSLLTELHAEDPALPRVLVIGDSIAIGQIETLRQVLAGKANILPGSQYKGRGLHTSVHALKDEWLAVLLRERGPFDVVQFNMGVHEFGGATDPDASSIPYGERLREVVKTIRTANPDGKVIWVSSTGTRPDNTTRPLYLAGAIAYNRAAAKVMAEEGVPVSDLFALTQPKVDEYIGDDNIHIRLEKRPEISRYLAENILRELKTPE
jgi:sialate O-acetylesterase